MSCFKIDIPINTVNCSHAKYETWLPGDLVVLQAVGVQAGMLISSQHLLITVWNVTSADKAPDTINRLLAKASRKFPLKRLLRPLS